MAYQTNVLRNTIIHAQAPMVPNGRHQEVPNRDEGDEGDRENSLNTHRHSGRHANGVMIRNPVEFVIRI